MPPHAYSPVEKGDPESALPSPAQQPAPTPAKRSKRLFVGFALGSIAALHVGAKFGPALVGKASGLAGGCHQHAEDGYLRGALSRRRLCCVPRADPPFLPSPTTPPRLLPPLRRPSYAALIDDDFTFVSAYVENPPMIAPHPAISLAQQHLAAVAHVPGFPIPPKVAEGIFLGVPDATSCMEASRRYTDSEHIAGSGNDQLSALRLKQEYEALFGVPTTGPFEHVFDAGSGESQAMVKDKHDKPQVWVDTYFPVMNTPVDREISILLPNSSFAAWSAKLREDIVEGDPFSELRDEVPVFHGLSKSGNVTGQLVYAAYGRKSDFDALAEAGIDVKGKVAIVKCVPLPLSPPSRATAGEAHSLTDSAPAHPSHNQVRRRLPRAQGPSRAS